ncbi:DUF7017 domain-containing protein [Thermaurantimonas aggregans]|uniref:DUF7017 domain-containing protein n=1 Tax=Thermaurantimonas aggregans TaxID=2173829 RepID=UPI003C6F2730
MWLLTLHLFKITTYPDFNYSQLDLLFQLIKKIPYQRPSKAHSFLLSAILTHSHTYPHTYELLEWWNLKNLRPEDYQLPQNKTDNINTSTQKINITLAERTWLAYTRLTINRLSITPPDHPEHTRLNYKATQLLNRLRQINQANPQLQYLPLYRIKLAHTLRKPIDAQPEFIAYARTRPKEFWIYSTLADITDDPEQQKALLAMAIHLAPKPEYSIRARKKIIKLFLTNNFTKLASAQLNKLIEIYNQNKNKNWRLPSEIREYLMATWYDPTIEIPDQEWTIDFIHDAATFIYHDFKPLNVAIGAQIGNKIYEYFAHQTQHGKARIINLTPIKNIEAEYFKALLHIDEQQTHIVLTQQIPLPQQEPPIKNVEGPVQISPDKKFALIKQKYYVPPQLIEKHHLKNGQNLKATVLRAWDNKKEKFGWKCIKIIQ